MTRAARAEELLSHAGWIRDLARSLVFDQDRVDDVVQEAWLAALESPPREGRGRNWLTVVTRNAVRRMHRQERRRARREAVAARPEATASAAEVASRVERERQVVTQVLQLDEPYKTVILYRFFDGLPPRKIARVLDCPVETVRTRLQRGLARLRERLDRAYGDRRTWSLALLPLLSRSPRTTSLPVAGGALVSASSLPMIVQVLAGVAAVALLGFVGFVGYRAWLGEVVVDPEEPSLSRARASGADAHALEPVSLEPPAASEPDRAAQAAEVREVGEEASGGVAGRWVAAAEPMLRGVVLDEESRPVQGVAVFFGVVPVDAGRLAPPAVTTDRDGAFALAAGSASARLQFIHPDYVDQSLILAGGEAGPVGAVGQVDPGEGWSYEDGQRTKILLLDSWRSWDGVTVLLRRSTISGVLEDELGRPIEGHPIRLDYQDEARCTATDERGTFRFERVPPKRHVIYVCRRSCREADETALLSRVVDVAPGEDVEIALSYGASEIIEVHGVLTRGGRPYRAREHGELDPGVVWIHPGAPEMPRYTEASSDDGRFSIELGRPGRQVVWVVMRPSQSPEERFYTFVEEIPERREVFLTLELPEGRISGLLTDAASLEPVGGGRVFVYPALEGVREVLERLAVHEKLADPVDGATGRFEVAGFEDGPYRIWVKAPGYEETEVDVRVERGLAPEVRIALERVPR